MRRKRLSKRWENDFERFETRVARQPYVTDGMDKTLSWILVNDSFFV